LIVAAVLNQKFSLKEPLAMVIASAVILILISVLGIFTYIYQTRPLLISFIILCIISSILQIAAVGIKEN
jgi:xanthine/uracil/vitamin C permease (AzgA family)